MQPGDGWCLITGASYGIGNSIAREMASRGYDVILVARTTSKLTECAEQCRAFGVQAKVVTQDLALENSPEQLWKKARLRGPYPPLPAAAAPEAASRAPRHARRCKRWVSTSRFSSTTRARAFTASLTRRAPLQVAPASVPFADQDKEH